MFLLHFFLLGSFMEIRTETFVCVLVPLVLFNQLMVCDHLPHLDSRWKNINNHLWDFMTSETLDHYESRLGSFRPPTWFHLLFFALSSRVALKDLNLDPCSRSPVTHYYVGIRDVMPSNTQWPSITSCKSGASNSAWSRCWCCCLKAMITTCWRRLLGKFETQ